MKTFSHIFNTLFCKSICGWGDPCVQSDVRKDFWEQMIVETVVHIWLRPIIFQKNNTVVKSRVCYNVHTPPNIMLRTRLCSKILQMALTPEENLLPIKVCYLLQLR